MTTQTQDAITDFDRVEINPEAVYLVHYHKLSEKAIKNKRARLQRLIAEAHQKIADYRTRVEYWTSQLHQLEDQLRVLTSPELEEWFQAQKRAKRQAEQKAEEFLREQIGDEAYRELKKEGVLTFVAKDGETYKIDSHGRVYKWANGHIEELCLIRDRSLPIPDYILAALTSVREEPARYRPRAQRR